MDQTAARRARWARRLNAAALMWGLALVGSALLVPVYSGTSSSATMSTDGATVVTSTRANSATLVQENGSWVLIVMAIPALTAGLVWAALRHKRTRGSHAASVAAWVLISGLAASCLLALFSIGLFVVPVAGLLAGAASLTSAARPPRTDRGVKP